MPGKITRLLACSAEQRHRYPERGMQMGPTFVHENFVDNPLTHGVKSGSYNKRAAVMFVRIWWRCRRRSWLANLSAAGSPLGQLGSRRPCARAQGPVRSRARSN